jgi:hypothetical protein
VLATPKKDVVQAIGRVLRKVLVDGDIRPLIIDVVDELSVFINQGKIRKQFYKKSQYEIDDFEIKDDAQIDLKKIVFSPPVEIIFTPDQEDKKKQEIQEKQDGAEKKNPFAFLIKKTPKVAAAATTAVAAATTITAEAAATVTTTAVAERKNPFASLANKP